MPKADITPKTKKAVKSAVPTNEDIALRAYHIYLERNGASGDAHTDWLRAEQELRAETVVKKSKARKKSNVTPIAA